jgi:hypothetical protein
MKYIDENKIFILTPIKAVRAINSSDSDMYIKWAISPKSETLGYLESITRKEVAYTKLS